MTSLSTRNLITVAILHREKKLKVNYPWAVKNKLPDAKSEVIVGKFPGMQLMI